MNNKNSLVKQFVRWVKVLVITAGLLAALYYGDQYLVEMESLRSAKNMTQEELEKLKAEKVQAWEQTFAIVKHQIAKDYGVDEDIVEVLLAKESGKGGKRDAIRFEPHHMNRVKKYSKNPETQKMLASSHGAWQVMGWHFAERGQSWVDAYDAEKGTEMAMVVWTDCRERVCKEGVGRYDCIEKTASCYNGSKEYGKDFMARLARRVIDSENKCN